MRQTSVNNEPMAATERDRDEKEDKEERAVLYYTDRPRHGVDILTTIARPHYLRRDSRSTIRFVLMGVSNLVTIS